MSPAVLSILIAVLLFTAWLGRRATPPAQLALWISALVISAAMFLPMSELRSLIAPDVLMSMESALGRWSWTMADAVHLIVFLWLAMLLWALRPDLRGWRAVAVLMVLAVAAELVQGLTLERESAIGDVGINLLGAGAGLVTVIAVSALWRVVRSRRIAQD